MKSINSQTEMNNKPIIELDEYQKLAEKTSGAGGFGDHRLIIAALGLTGEAGEFANLVKKRTAHGHNITREELAYDIGDVLWYLAEAATTCGLTLAEIATLNINKLKKRYPNGFSSERSINRE